MTTMIRPTSPAPVQPGRLLGARQLADVVRRLAASPADWLARVRLNPAGRWYERIHLDDSHEVWVISWLPGQATGFHDHGERAGRPAVVVKPGGLARQPADHPYLVAVIEVYPLVPAALRIQPDPAQPARGTRRQASYHLGQLPCAEQPTGLQAGW